MQTFNEFYLTMYSAPVRGESLDKIQQQQIEVLFLYIDYVLKQRGLYNG